MKTIERNRRGIKKTSLISVLIFSTLATRANTVSDEFNHLVHDRENLTMVYVLGGMFIGCIVIYLIASYLSKKGEQTEAKLKPTPQRLARQKVIKKTS